MNELSERPELGWNLLCAAAIIAAAYAIWVAFLEPNSTAAMSKDGSPTDIRRTTQKARDKVGEDLKNVQQKTWDVGVDALGSSVLEVVSKATEKAGVQMTGFRSERTVDVADLVEAPFVVVIEGGYNDVLAFEKALEGGDSKLAINRIQFTASDSAPGRVTATLGIVGFKTKEATS
jgi:hypothetical protein